MSKIILLSLLLALPISSFCMEEVSTETVEMKETTKKPKKRARRPAKATARKRSCGELLFSRCTYKQVIKAAVAAGVLTFCSVITEAANGTDGIEDTNSRLAIPRNATLTGSSHCSYRLADDCDGVDNEDRCERYLNSDEYVIVEKCSSEIDAERVGLGFGSMTAHFCEFFAGLIYFIA